MSYEHCRSVSLSLVIRGCVALLVSQAENLEVISSVKKGGFMGLI